MLTTAGAARCTAAEYVRRAGPRTLGALAAGAGAEAGAGGEPAFPRMRSGRTATITKASASPPTTDPAMNVNPRLSRSSMSRPLAVYNAVLPRDLGSLPND